MNDSNKANQDSASKKSGRNLGNLERSARMLQREARRILKRHEGRIGTTGAEAIRASIAAIETALGRVEQDSEDAGLKLERESETLDQLLHTHARFARKSAIRETFENISFAVLVALGLRTCLYEPFKIPSPSMVPTLREGDHIFVNKFAYGVQIPFTNTIVAEDWLDEIKRGDVIVFRYPLDESDDYIKRVMALPGDEIRVDGQDIWLKPKGENEFRKHEREELSKPCTQDGIEVPGCLLFSENNGERSYIVRYKDGRRGPFPAGSPRTYKVPEGNLLVMGDNRNVSSDSLRWTAMVEAVSAEGVLSVKDLRDLTDEESFFVERDHKKENYVSTDIGRDQISIRARHRSTKSSIDLEVWRSAILPVSAINQAWTRTRPDFQKRSFDSLLGETPSNAPIERERLVEIGNRIDQIRVGEFPERFESDFCIGLNHSGSTKDGNGTTAAACLHLSCGKAICKDEQALAFQIGEVVQRFHQNPERNASRLISRPSELNIVPRQFSRGEVDRRYAEFRFRPSPEKSKETDTNHSPKVGEGVPANEVRIRIWKRIDQGRRILSDAILASWGSDRDHAQQLAELHEDAWVIKSIPDTVAMGIVLADREQDTVFAVECGSEYCQNDQVAVGLAKKLLQATKSHAPRRSLRAFLPRDLLSRDWVEVPNLTRTQMPWDRVTLEGHISDERYAFDLEVVRAPKMGLDAQVAKWKAALEPSDQTQKHPSFGANGWIHRGPNGQAAILSVADTETALKIVCAPALCSDESTFEKIVQRAIEKANDTNNFVAAEAQRPRPFVPRGNVKGRAERIWLPPSRFWLPIE